MKFSSIHGSSSPILHLLSVHVFYEVDILLDLPKRGLAVRRVTSSARCADLHVVELALGAIHCLTHLGLLASAWGTGRANIFGALLSAEVGLLRLIETHGGQGMSRRDSSSSINAIVERGSVEKRKESVVAIWKGLPKALGVSMLPSCCGAGANSQKCSRKKMLVRGKKYLKGAERICFKP